jgi:hypothetical protein
VTTPKIQTAYRGGARVYIHPESGEEAYGVTSALNMEPKPFLKAWAAKVVAETAFHEFETLSAMVRSGDETGAIEWLKKAPDRYTREAADFGSAAHELMEAEALFHSGLASVSADGLIRFHPSRWHEGLTQVLVNFREFLAEFEVEYVYMEETVWSRTHGYAGSFDALVTLVPAPGAPRELVWLDYKTSKSVYGSTGKQLAGYSNADFLVFEDGTTEEITPAMREAGGAVLWNRPEGWRLHPVNTGEEVFAQFLRDLETLKYEKTTARSVVGRPVNKGAQKKRRARKEAAK